MYCAAGAPDMLQNNKQLCKHEKMWVEFWFKISKYDNFLISNGNSFHSLGAAQANARSQSVIFVLCDGVCSNIEYIANWAGCECVGVIWALQVLRYKKGLDQLVLCIQSTGF